MTLSRQRSPGGASRMPPRSILCLVWRMRSASSAPWSSAAVARPARREWPEYYSVSSPAASAAVLTKRARALSDRAVPESRPVIRNRSCASSLTAASGCAVRIAASGTRIEETLRPWSARRTTYMATRSGSADCGSRPRLRHHYNSTEVLQTVVCRRGAHCPGKPATSGPLRRCLARVVG